MSKNKTSKLLQKHNSHALPQTVQKLGWNFGERALSYEDATEIGDFKGEKLYGYVPSNFQTDTRWQNALTKGFAKTQYGHNGVKFLDGKLLELKINDNDRLCATEVYANSKGDYLVIFSNETDHKGISSILKSTKVLSASTCSSNIEENTNNQTTQVYCAKQQAAKAKSLAYAKQQTETTVDTARSEEDVSDKQTLSDTIYLSSYDDLNMECAGMAADYTSDV